MSVPYRTHRKAPKFRVLFGTIRKSKSDDLSKRWRVVHVCPMRSRCTVRKAHPFQCQTYPNLDSSTNSVKRLNNDAAVKAVAWLHEFGQVSMVPTAVLSGVYKTHNLVSAQERGLALFWGT